MISAELAESSLDKDESPGAGGAIRVAGPRHAIGSALSPKADASTGRCGMGEAPSAPTGALRYDPFQQDRQSRRSRIRE